MNVVNILNTIRANSDSDYQARVPEATKTNLADIGNAITEFTPTMNSFCNVLVNRIIMTLVNTDILKNPLATLKKPGIPYGQAIQEMYTNPAKGSTYTFDSQDLLKVVKADVKVNYFDVERTDKYSVSISKMALRKAFTNESTFSDFVVSLVNSLYSGDNYDEFLMMKKLITTAYTNNHIKKVEVFKESENLDDEVIGKRLVKLLKQYSLNMTFPSSDYNSYVGADGETKLVTWTPKDRQVLILNSTISANIDVDVLAYAFNLDKAQIVARKIDIDNFFGEPILGILVDEKFFKVYDTLNDMESMWNGDNLSLKYMWHHWQIQGYSTLCNAVAFYYTPTTE